MRMKLITLCMTIAFLPGAASALTLEELKRYDKDGNGKLNGQEKDIYDAHQRDAILAKYDRNIDGVLDARELQQLRNDIEKRGGAKRPAPAQVADPQEKFAAGKGAYEAAHGGIPLQD